MNNSQNDMRPPKRKIRTNLFELINAMHDEGGTHSDDHIVAAVRYLAASGKIRWIANGAYDNQQQDQCNST